MRKLFNKAIGIFSRQESGFTLVELVVVIGIIAALTGVTFFAVNRFSGEGDVGALKVETATVQNAMYSMMAKNQIASVTANGGTSSSVNAWTTNAPTEGSLYRTDGTGFLKKSTTKFYYCWDASGNIWSLNGSNGTEGTVALAKAGGTACFTRPT